MFCMFQLIQPQYYVLNFFDNSDKIIIIPIFWHKIGQNKTFNLKFRILSHNIQASEQGQTIADLSQKFFEDFTNSEP